MHLAITTLQAQPVTAVHFAENLAGTARASGVARMPVNRPDLNAFMDAYALLGVGYGANPLDIRAAFKRQTREHHPDRFPPGSPEQLQATQRMAAVNAAYQLVKDAPLRHHRVSTGARPDDPWRDDELDAAISRAQRDAMVDRAISVALSTVGVSLYLFWRGGGGWWAWHPVDIVVGTALGFVAYWMAGQTRTGHVIWEVVYMLRFGRRLLANARDFSAHLPDGR